MTALVDMSIEQIMEADGVGRRTAYSHLRKASRERNGAGASEAMKNKVVAYLTSHGVQENLERLHDLTAGSIEEVARAVWSLQGDGVVTFYERRVDGVSHIGSIKLAAGVRAKKSKTNRHARHPVGKDMTDAKNHKTVAIGGPVETQTYMNDVLVDMSIKQTMDILAPQTVVDVKLDTPPEYSFPLIEEIMKHRKRLARYEAAAEILSTPLGDDYDDFGNEVALRLLENTGLTELEKEVITYVQLHP